MREEEREREMEKQEQRGRRLVLVTSPFQGHINPMLQLATILHSKGFSITIAHTKFNSPNSTNHPDFNFLPIPDGLSDRDISSGDVIAMVSIINVNCEAPLRELLAQMMERQDKHGEIIACIIYDGVMYFSEAVANHLKVPSIIVRTSSAGTGLAQTAIPRLRAEGYIPLQGMCEPALLYMKDGFSLITEIGPIQIDQ